MASVQEPGIVKVFHRKMNGDRIQLLSASVAITAPAGGAPDHALSSVKTPDQLLHVPVHSSVIQNDEFLEVEFTADGADGIDVSDSVWLIPLMTSNGVKFISEGQFQNPALADWTTVAAIPTIAGGYKNVDGPVRFGGGPLYIDFQDDT